MQIITKQRSTIGRILDRDYDPKRPMTMSASIEGFGQLHQPWIQRNLSWQKSTIQVIRSKLT